MSRNIFRIAIVLAVLSALVAKNTAWAAEPLDAETIKAALKTTDQEEDGFVQRVVDRVNQGTLPRKTVETAFVWAKRKSGRKFQYFRRAVIVLAARQGIKVS